MSDKRGPSQVPEIVLVSGRTSARFDGSRLLITRGRTSWTLPVKALSAAKLRARGTVVIAISGPAAAARHGLGPPGPSPPRSPAPCPRDPPKTATPWWKCTPGPVDDISRHRVAPRARR